MILNQLVFVFLFQAVIRTFMLNDLLIFKKIKEGDIVAFEHIFRSYYSPLYLYAVSITGRSDVSEEIIQDLFYLLWRDRESLQIFTSVKAYLYGAVRNRSLQYREHSEVQSRHRDHVLSGKIEISGSDPQEQLEYKEFEQLINDTLYKMPQRRLKIFQMHRFQGVKYTEIADFFSISVKTVEAEMTRAYKTLRKVIENYTQTV